MSVYNVKIAVVACVEAPDEASAIAWVDRRLVAAGFGTLTDCGAEYADAFEAEYGTEVTWS
jgi:hypothetical protein